MIDIDKLRSEFTSRYGCVPRIFCAPGRVNLIGEHTDYNDGLVLPCALDFATYVAGSLRRDRRIRAASLSFEHKIEFDLDTPLQPTEKGWTKYVRGVALVLERQGYNLPGANLLIDSDVPVGAGLSSSAALEIAVGYALASISGYEIDGMKLARIGQIAEHEFAGVRSGIMDQFVSVFGQAKHALFLDCRTMEWSPVPIASAQFLICNTKTKHDLADSEYNRRRAECEEAASFLGRGSLSDVIPDEFEALSVDMPETLKRRARHIITENARVLASVSALKKDNMVSLGKLLNDSHDSLRYDFEVSCPELDLMVNLARSRDDVLGVRMTGGGFGGCTINLMATVDHCHFIDNVSKDYYRETGIVPDIYKCEIGRGAYEL